MRPDQLTREVNRLYWETDGPVTRLADELGISRGTFYNHLTPLPAEGTCAKCGAALVFRTRSNRDSGSAHCESCGNEQAAAGDASSKRSGGAAARSSASARKASGAQSSGSPSSSSARRLRIDRENDDAEVASHEVRLLLSRSSWLSPEDPDERMRTQLLAVAVGAAVLGLGILYFSRRR